MQASELRIIDQLDNLYLLLDPEVNGAPEPATDFAARMFGLFTDAKLPNEDPDIDIATLSDDCPQGVKDIR